MNPLILLSSLLFSIFCYVEAQNSSSNQNNSTSPSPNSNSSSNQNNPTSPSPNSNSSNNFQPSIAVILAILVVMILLSICVALYTKFCYQIAGVQDHHNQQTLDGLLRPGAISSGIDKIVIESLPFFKFSSLKGLRGGLECAVCLSKFEDVEVLRLLPKCKHAFHINCVDQWLENHSSCPLCRQRISVEDLAYTNSMRFLLSQSEVRQDSNVELFVQRESKRHGSSRFSIGNSFRVLEKGASVKEDEIPIREEYEGVEENDKSLHKLNHRIIMSGAVLKSRWSNLSSSDLLFLNSEMLGDMSSNRFPPLDSNRKESSTTRATAEGGISKIKEEMERKRDFENKVGKLNQNDSFPLSIGANNSNPKRNLHLNEKRSMSEIGVHSRFKEFNMRSDSVEESPGPENAAKEERLKRLWMPIARKTVQWYANRDKKSQQSNHTRQSSNV